MAQSQNNPLINPESNLPGVSTASGADVGYPNAEEQTYYEAGGPRQKGEPKGTDYNGPAAS